MRPWLAFNGDCVNLKTRSMDINQQEPIYELIGDNTAELARAMRVCLMGGDIHQPLTFAPQLSETESFLAMWRKWRSEFFDPLLAPHLLKVFSAIQSGDARRVIALDQELEKGLKPNVAERSALAGSQFQAQMDGARHVKVLDKLHKAVLEQAMPGHHATFFASEAAVFNVPMMHLLPAFLFAEWRRGRIHLGKSSATNSMEAFHEQCQDDLAAARDLFSRTIGGEHTLGVCA